MSEPLDLEAMRQREVQMMGAALSIRSWHEMENAYSQLRDKIDRELIRRRQAERAAQPPQPQRETFPSLELCVQFSEDGKHIRRWSRIPFEGGECLYSHPATLPAAASVEAGERAQIVAWLREGNHRHPDFAFAKVFADAIERGDHLTAKGKDQADG